MSETYVWVYILIFNPQPPKYRVHRPSVVRSVQYHIDQESLNNFLFLDDSISFSCAQSIYLGMLALDIVNCVLTIISGVL